ncbi:MAG: hypothetical protein JOZ57_15890, partial [Abitibacteriaceae bacterium]|nr:hypothetical protein [Abditibacteriaceae bacterium]
MLSLLDIERSTYQTVALPDALDNTSQPCDRCKAFRVDPQLDGNLQVDPEIFLPSPGLNVDIGYYYNSNTQYNGPFGYGRTITPNLLAQANGSPAWVSFSRGNGAIVSYQDDGSGTFVPQTPRLLNTVIKDTVNNLWKEVTPAGITTAYPLDTTGQVTSVTYIEDAVGNRHSFLYQAGRLQNLQDAVGRLVTFNYVNV